jgi:hypothetical protein
MTGDVEVNDGPSMVAENQEADEDTDLRIELRPAAPLPRFPTPVEAEAFAMPADNRLGLDDD